jgi:hypothetical protein
VQHLYKSTSCQEFYGGYSHVHTLSTSCFDRSLGSILTFYKSTSTTALNGRSLLHLSQQNRFVRLVYTQFVGWARMMSCLDYILSRCTQGSFILCLTHSRPAAMPAFAPNEFDPLIRFLPNSWSALI